MTPKDTEKQETQLIANEQEKLRMALLRNEEGILMATRSYLARLARARGVAPHSVDDVIQETLLEAWQHLERLYDPTGFQPWIAEICRNVCRRTARKAELEHMRRERVADLSFAETYSRGGMAYDVVEDIVAPDATDPFEALSRQELVCLLDRALGHLSPVTRQIIELCHLYELPHTEVAMHLGISPGTLDTRLHRARQQLRQVLSGPLQQEALDLGLALDQDLIEGWQDTSLWCPLCGQQHLQGCFIQQDTGSQGTNLHLRCPDCSHRYGQDTVHSMGLIRLSGVHSYRPAWKRTMQGFSERITQALLAGQHPCVWCGCPALIQIKTQEHAQPYPCWIYLFCPHCQREMDASGCMPAIDQLVYWSHPDTRQFLQRYPRARSKPGQLIEYKGVPAIAFGLETTDSRDTVSIVVQRSTLHVLSRT